MNMRRRNPGRPRLRTLLPAALTLLMALSGGACLSAPAAAADFSFGVIGQAFMRNDGETALRSALAESDAAQVQDRIDSLKATPARANWFAAMMHGYVGCPRHTIRIKHIGCYSTFMMPAPLLTFKELEQMRIALKAGAATLECSLDLQLSRTTVEIGATDWAWEGRRFPYPDPCKERTVYYWADDGFQPVARYASSLIKLVPTDWGAPTFEIDGIKMLPTALVSPYLDAERKVGLIQPRGKNILDTCGGLGYFAAWCLRGQAAHVQSYEKNADVIWLRSINPWSPPAGGALALAQGDVTQAIATLAGNSIDAVLHDPPRFGIAGELYSQDFYEQLARVLKRKGRLFHYTGTPNKLSSGRDVANEVANRLRNAGFSVTKIGDGVLASKK